MQSADRRAIVGGMRWLWVVTLVACSRTDRAVDTPIPRDKQPEPAAPTAPTPPPAEAISDPHRGLTRGERALLEPLFRQSLDYEKIQVIDGKFLLQPNNVYMTPRGNIYAPGALFEADFSTASPWRQAVFVHEITHVWQFENGMDLVAQGLSTFAKAGGAYERAYPYTLADGRDLVDYGMEQQASIVEDYFLITKFHESPQRIENRIGPAQRDALYATVLGKFLNYAKYARAMSAKDVADRHVAAAKANPPDDKKNCEAPEANDKAQHLCGWRFQ
jgi:hypothetical protein